MTLDHVKTFCGKGTKVKAAGALGDTMTAGDAAKFVEIGAFLRSVAST